MKSKENKTDKIYGSLNRIITISKYDPNWPILFQKEKSKLIKILQNNDDEIEHVGSTAVVSICAKPIIDIALKIDNLSNDKKIITQLENHNYIYVPELEEKLPNRRFLWSGTKQVHKYHLWVVETNGQDWQDLINVRNYLQTHRNIAKEYGELKSHLALICGNDIGSYVKKKSTMYYEILKKAKEFHIKT